MSRAARRALRVAVPLLVLLAAAVSLPASAVAQEGDARAAPRPVEPPAPFLAAVEAGSRSLDGRPGAGYWQQEVDYRIDAELDPGTGRLEGRETITYRNNSPDVLDLIRLRLEQNVYAAGARRNRRAPVTGGIQVGPVHVQGQPVETRHPGRGYSQALTLLDVELPEPLPPGGSTTLEITWSYTVPPAPTFRNGNLDGEVFAVAQWYPRVAVYDDIYGWHRSPYLGDGEFYLEYGDFEVNLTVPAGWLVGATGTLTNVDEVLTEAVRRRLAEAATSDTAVSVVDADGRGPGRATRGGAGELVTWTFSAERVRGFAFSTSDRYVWDAFASEGGTLVQALYRPRFDAWREAARFLAFTVATLEEWIGPYPYPQLTTAEGPVGGMEYPMMMFISGRSSVRSVAGTTVHEAAHMWFPMVVGSMEAKHAWMDEGFVSYFDEMVSSALWDEEPPRWGLNERYLAAAGREDEVPIMRHTDLVSPYGLRGLAAYTKPAVVLGALREVVGPTVFRRAFQEYYRAWSFKHPQPWDFMNLMERHAGQEMDWFWRPLLFETRVLDHAVTSVEFGANRTRIELEDRGGVVLPTPVRVTTAEGVLEERVSAARWLEEGRRVVVEVPGRALVVELDPEGHFPDVDRSNNRWEGR